MLMTEREGSQYRRFPFRADGPSIILPYVTVALHHTLGLSVHGSAASCRVSQPLIAPYRTGPSERSSVSTTSSQGPATQLGCQLCLIYGASMFST